ncbi:MAG: hypothetical protein HYZ92_07165 [Candidatus Omnitrophica bacterium]|nr:hypothetical protein [Candidatus Omnitrophota bacterium]
MRIRPVLAVDLGATKIACALGAPRPPASQTNGHLPSAGWDLLGCGLAAYPLGGASWPCDPFLIADVLEPALRELKYEPLPDSAIVALSHPDLAHHRVIAHIDIADEPVTIRGREVARLKSQALSQALALDRDVLELETLGYAGNGFDEIRDPRGLPATRLSGRFQLVTVPLAVKRAILQGFERMGLEVDRLCYVPATIARTWAKAATQPKPGESTGRLAPNGVAAPRILLVDIGGSSTELAVADDGCLVRSASLAWGGLALADTLARSGRLTLDQAATASLQGFSSPTESIRRVVEAQTAPLGAGIREILDGLALPGQAIVTGRGALIDGMVEWIGQVAGIGAVLGRSPHVKAFGDLGRQVALSGAVALLETACGQRPSTTIHPTGLVNRILDRTRQILIDYF